MSVMNLLYKRPALDSLGADHIMRELEEIQVACEDIWQVIRHQLWLDNPNRNEWDVASRPLINVSDEPHAKIKKEVCG